MVVALLLLQLAYHACTSFAAQSSLPRLRPLSTKLQALRGGSVDYMPDGPPLAMTSAHWMSAAECLDSLRVSTALGLSSAEAAKRLQHYGTNTLTEAPSKSLLRLVAEQFSDRLVQVLLGVAALSAALAFMEKDAHAFTEPVVIVAILLLNALVGVWQSKSAEDSLSSLRKLQPEQAAVLRDGLWRSDFPAALLVPGDVIQLRVGDKVPADARIVRMKTSSFLTNEASLTGESMSASKGTDAVDVAASLAAKSNMVFSGTLVSGGAALAVVTGTGAGTEMGAINAGVQAAKETQMKTPLAEKLDAFGAQLSKLVGGICVAMWLMNFNKFSSPAFSSTLQGAAYYAKASVALGVAAIPEGLPAIITLCLSLGTRRMAKRQVIVRKLSSVETLGCTTVICTDKTGTLTTNQMTSKALVTFTAEGVQERGVEGVSYAPFGTIEGLRPADMLAPHLAQLARIYSLCNEAALVWRPEDGGAYGHSGEPTEAALRTLVEKLSHPSAHRNGPPEVLARQCRDFWESAFTPLAVLEFSRDRKSMGVLVRELNGSNSLMVKGAAEMVLGRCNRIMLDDGSIVPISAAMRSELVQKLRDMAGRPLRCLAAAFKSGAELGPLAHISSAEDASACDLLKHIEGYAAIESDMVLVGLVGIKDPARPEAAAAMDRCAVAGIRVIMITGDSYETAVAIAKDVCILSDKDDLRAAAFSGSAFFALPEADQLALLRTGNKVFCRAEPRHKQRLITLLEKLGEIPAMTGDGVNDAPALQQAAIGIAMGITGTEVAKSAADMVLADDNFSSIVAAVEEGRNIFANMQAFVCFLISSNIGEVAAVFLGALLGLPELLTPLHLLWVNLVTDGPPATALGFNPPDPAAMTQPPRDRNESLLSRWMMVRYTITGLYVGAATIGAFVWWFLDKGVTWEQLTHWADCASWDLFAHSAEAPNWPAQPCNIFGAGLLTAPRTMSLSVLVCIELLKALSAVSLDQSLLTVAPWRNAYLPAAVALPMALHLAALYLKPLAGLFGLHPLSWEQWKVVLAFALPVLLLEEVLKAIGRRINRSKAARQLEEKAAKQHLF